MTDDDAKTRILAFASHVGREGNDAETVARNRNWLDGEGNVTDDGRDLLESLGSQNETRTVFRGNF